ncbi:MAG TPA: AAA family ATPase [Bryobacteraceae bacterium]|nr:AAA family ATPase [Bryobacteraceae bacterium]
MSPIALDHITIRGFKSIASIEKLKLRSINVLIGPNGSGKSNFIGAFDFIRVVGQGRLRDYAKAAGGAERILHLGSKRTKEVYFQVVALNGGHYELTVARTADDSLYSSREQGVWIGMSGDPRHYTAEPESEGIARWARYQSGHWRIYHFHDTSSSSPMRKTAKADDNEFLQPDGSNLAPFLYNLRQKYGDSYKLIQRTVQRVAPFFDDFQLEPLADDIKLEWRHTRSDQYFDASSLSDGTLRFLALATLFLQPEACRRPVILVDEPDLGLHPYAIEMLAALIRQAAVSTQVIVSTQSSLLLDHFKPEDVLVANRVDGATQLARLDSSQLSSWLKDYSLGQLWEKNEFGGRPVRD